MPEPTTSTGIAVAAISVATLALLGVDYYSLLWAFLGAVFAVWVRAGEAEPEALAHSPVAPRQSRLRKLRIIFYVALSTLAGAAFGTAALEAMSSDSRPLLIVASLVGGYGGQLIVASLLGASIRRIEKLGGR